jgi:hypothetical protein
VTNQIAFTANNRPFYLRPVIESWNAARNLPYWHAQAYIEPSDVQEEMSEIILGLNTSVDVILNETTAGVLTNPWNALEAAFSSGADFVVLAEDDVVVSNDVLEYFEWASIEYETSHHVLTINAFSQLGGSPNTVTTEDANFNPLIWGTWKNRWYDYLRDTWDKDYSTGNPDGSEAGWDWNINRIIKANDFTVVKPFQSRSDHIGEYLGTHMTPDLYPESRGTDFSQTRGRFRYVEI